ncbi:MAG: hypothetical protein GX075_11930 [Firmicutes bacterium]|nr:hypothetical protein [Bacillota bacterium]
MRCPLLSVIVLGMLLIMNNPVQAEFHLDKAMLKLDSTEGKKLEEDLYFYSSWFNERFRLNFTNKFSWPEHNENYNKFSVKAGFEEIRQLKMNLDYQWNRRYRIPAAKIAYYHNPKAGWGIGIEYQNDNREPVSDEDLKYKYHTETGIVKFDLQKDDWRYDLKLAQTRRDYPGKEVDSYAKNELEQGLAWRFGPNFRLDLSYYETTSYYPNDLTITKDRWSSKQEVGGEYRFSHRWRLTGSFSVQESEKGLLPYLEKQSLEFKLNHKPAKDLNFDLRIRTTEFDFFSEAPYFDPDETPPEDDDRKSRTEGKIALESNLRLRNANLWIETGVFLDKRDYRLASEVDIAREGLYTSISWNPGNIGIELEIAPNGNLWRVNGFYQLKVEYHF